MNPELNPDALSQEEQEILDALSAAGLSRSEILKRLSYVIKADKSRVYMIDPRNGEIRIRERVQAKDMAAVVEISRGKIKFADPVAAMKLALEVSRMMPKQKQVNQITDQRKQAVVFMPKTLPTQEAWQGLLPANEVMEAEVIENVD